MKRLAVALALVVAGAGPAEAAVVIQPVSGQIVSGGPGFGSITATLNQAGLLSPYQSRVTDFDAYLASRPLQDPDFTTEWFSNIDTSAARLVYDLGSVLPIDGVAHWNEDAAGAQRIDYAGSVDGVTFFTLLAGARPTNNPLIGENGAPYPADIFRFAQRVVRYVRVDLLDCPQPEDGQEFPSCSIGEIAFRSPTASEVVPLPPAAILFAVALALSAAGRKKAGPFGPASRRERVTGT